ncbi:type VI secretion protein, family [Roseibium sp. TrichSKD4]|uniref:type VI secretion system contractile sheath small subunit n=1 Tax=Roseibium sp. TrichSKD4 TaxID=744980 RepID=UPI0001E56E41|nr:type VI secretion system contractile sheath small subunit [Roseibium sp. TrichSKD4]EFO30306.1 type VI secretion protein, family [Roseibium sp. TrichSKD4]
MAGKEGSVAPKERINIRYVPATGDQQEEVELPLRLVMLGDYLGREDDTPLEEREVLSVDKNSFASVMEEAGLSRELNVKDTLSDDDDARLTVNLNFKGLNDFSPDAIVKQVPELDRLIELREALVALKGPLGNIPAFRKRLEQILEDEDSRQKLIEELQRIEDASAEAQPGEYLNGAAASANGEHADENGASAAPAEGDDDTQRPYLNS